jgi:predicted nucleotidyltransferase
MDKIVGINDVKKVALALKDLSVNFAFVGGAIVSLYVNDKSADAPRETTDVDLSVSVKGYASWANLQDQLSQLGFSPDQDSKVICRYLYQGITVDIMPDDEKILGFSNPWYKSGLASIEVHKIDDGLDINLFPIPYFLATKFTAVRGRGKGDHRTSHDFEDVIYVTDNVSNIADIIEKADKEVKAFLVSEYTAIKDHGNRREIISAHLSRLIRDKSLSANHR